MSHDDPDRLEQIVRGISEGCLMSDCSLLGGETAIMPDLYAPGDYDLAGFCVGVVERHALLDGTAIVPGTSSWGWHLPDCIPTATVLSGRSFLSKPA